MTERLKMAERRTMTERLTMTYAERLDNEIARLVAVIRWHEQNAKGPFKGIPNCAHARALRDLDLRRKIRAGL